MFYNRIDEGEPAQAVWRRIIISDRGIVRVKNIRHVEGVRD